MGIDNDTYKVQGHWHEILVNMSIPLVKDEDDKDEHATCDLFSTNQNTTYNDENVPVNTSKKECDEWVYDKSTFENTFITKVLHHMHRIQQIVFTMNTLI